MTDNVTLNPGAGGASVRTVTRPGAQAQVVVLDVGGEASESLVTTGNPHPVSLYGVGGQSLASSATLPTTDSNVAQATSADAPLFAVITGDPSGDFAGVNLLEQVVSDGSGLAVNVRVLNPLLTDVRGAAVASDAPQQVLINLNSGQSAIIDTQGYQSLQLTTQALAGSVAASNDLQTWSSLYGQAVGATSYVTTLTASGNYNYPVNARYVRITATTTGTALGWLRAAPWNGGSYLISGVNLSQINGTVIVNGGVAGTLAVGGNVAPGVAPTLNPIPLVIDTSGLTRRLLSDAAGRLYVNTMTVDVAGTARQNGSVFNGSLASLATTDQSQVEGASIPELLLMVVTELKILNQQIYLLNTQGGASSSDDPQSFRNDPTIFVQ